MNFYQAPVTRYVSLSGAAAVATTFDQITPIPQSFSNSAPGFSIPTFRGGPCANLFFETPNWPSSAYAISLEYVLGAAGTTPLLVGPNVMIKDADANFFIRGNSLLANTSNTIVNIVYSAVLTNIQIPAASTRNSALNNAWVQPGDRIDIAGNGQSGTNQSNGEVATPGSTLTVQSCRVKTNPQTFCIEFNAAIRTDGLLSNGTGAGTFTVSNTTTANVAAHELTLRIDGTNKKLAVDNLTLNVVGRDPSTNAIIWTGTLTSAVNLSHPVNNKTGLMESLYDPSKFMQTSKAWASANLRPLFANGTTITSQRIFVDRDLVAGAEPYRCISLLNPINTANFVVAVTVSPIS